MRRLDREHRMAGPRPVERAVPLGPVEPLEVSRRKPTGQRLRVDPRPVTVQRRSGEQGCHRSQGAHDHHRRSVSAMHPLTPQKRREQPEQQRPLQVRDRRAQQRRGHHG